MNYEEMLMEYHRRIEEIFLAAGQSPFRICKQVWRLHAEMSRRLVQEELARRKAAETQEMKGNGPEV